MVSTRWDDFVFSLRCAAKSDGSVNNLETRLTCRSLFSKPIRIYQTSSELPVRAKPHGSPFRLTMYSCPGSTEPAIWSASCRMLSEGIARAVPKIQAARSAQCWIQDHYCMIKKRMHQMVVLNSAQEVSSKWTSISWSCKKFQRLVVKDNTLRHDATPRSCGKPSRNHLQCHEKGPSGLGIHHETLGV